jgi:hypothetical protein
MKKNARTSAHRIANRNRAGTYCVALREFVRRLRHRPGATAAIVCALLACAMYRVHAVAPETEPPGDGADPSEPDATTFGLTAVDAAGGGIALRFPGDEACYYVIESCTALALQDWIPAALIPGAKPGMTWSPPSGADARGLFRVRRIARAAAEDLDQDGLDDVTELNLGTDPLRPDAHEDPDRDGLSNALEAALGLDPFAWDGVRNAAASLETKSYTAIRRKFLEMPAYTDTPFPVPDPPHYYLRATVDAVMHEAHDLHMPGYEEFRTWSRIGSITVDPRTMKPTGTYTAMFRNECRDPDPLYATDATYTFAYTWTDGVPDLTITAEGTIGGDPVPLPEGKTNCVPWVGDAACGREIGTTEAFERKFLGDGAATLEQITYAYDEAHPDGEWTRRVDGSATLSQEFTTELLEELTEESLDQMPSWMLAWPELAWDGHKSRTWPWAYCGKLVDADNGGGTGLRKLMHPEDHTLELRRAKFRFRVNSTEPDQLYVLRWEERFHSLPPNEAAEETIAVRTVCFRGTGDAMYIGNPADSNDGGAFAALLGPDQAEDFTLDPPPREGGNGEVAVSILEVEIPRHAVVDLDLDADYDGVITDDDDPLETDPGGIVGIQNTVLNAIDPSLLPIRVRVEPVAEPAGIVELRIETDPHRTALWTSPSRDTRVSPLQWDLGNGETPPPTLYLEGRTVSTSPRDLSLRLVYHPPNDDPPIEDRVSLTIIRNSLAFDVNHDGAINDTDRDLASTWPGKLLPANIGNPQERESLYLALHPAGLPDSIHLRLAIDNPSILRVFDPNGTQILGPESADTWEAPLQAFQTNAWPLAFTTEGAAPGRTSLTFTCTNTAGDPICQDTAHVTTLAIDLVPDWNHDGQIDSSDSGQATESNPFRFWKNDDNDKSADAKTGGDDDLPGTAPTDAGDSRIDGSRDVIDFFPLFLNITNALDQLGTDRFRFILDYDGIGSVGLVYTDLEPTSAGDYLTDPELAENLVANATVHNFTGLQGSFLMISPDFLRKLRTENKGVVLIEMSEAGTDPIRFEIRDTSDNLLYTHHLPLRISGVEQMFRHVNLVDDLDPPERLPVEVPDRTHEPVNLPDHLSNGKNLVWVIGYNVSQQNARRWQSEIFKRLFWSGSRAKFTGVTWHGDTGVNYHKAVINAFVTSEALARELALLSGEITVCAHSAGNLVVSSAIADHGFAPDQYFMFNAAVPIEAYDAGQRNGTGGTVMEEQMLNPAWREYADKKLHASEWHNLFNSPDMRTMLTWRDRFARTQGNLWNYYSEGEEVLRNADTHLWGMIGAQFNERGAYAWAMQEMIKGLDGPVGLFAYALLLPDQHGGWGFNMDAYDANGLLPGHQRMIPAEAATLSVAELRNEPFFRHFSSGGQGQGGRFPDYDGRALFAGSGDPAANAQAALATTQYKLLAEAIPALSFSAGANFLDNIGTRSVHMQDYRITWPEARLTHPDYQDYWLHSDLKDISYPYIRLVFDQIVRQGDLQ